MSDEMERVDSAQGPVISSGTSPEEPGDDAVVPEKRTAGWVLMIAALALIAVPVLGGYLLIRGDSSASTDTATNSASDMRSSGMGSSDMGGSTDSAVAVLPPGVLPFSTIQANDITIEPSGGGAVLRVNTTIDVACAVAYGPTDALGSLATDTDMAGGGHSVHQPAMKGLVSGATYFYRIQATGPDGALYQSDLMSFVQSGDSGGAEPIPPPAPNVAYMARVTDVSSEYSDAFAGQNAVDEDPSTEWSTAGDGDDAFIVLEFSDEMVVQGVGFRTREMTDGTSITLSYTVTVDGKTTFGPFDAGPGLAVGLAEFRGYEIRFDVETSTGGNTGAVEVEVYGEEEM